MGFIKYPTNCFLCFNIKNVITFSVIFNNYGSIQSFFLGKIIFLSKNFEMSQNRSVTISLRAPLRTKNEISFLPPAICAKAVADYVHSKGLKFGI